MHKATIMKRVIHVFCLKPPICSLIKKRFTGSNYIITCSNADSLRDNLLESLNKNTDCIIIDKDISDELKKRIRNYFKDKPIICLPSLDSDVQSDGDVTNISEPFRLSELAETLDEIFAVK